jgi:penicillin amidase
MKLSVEEWGGYATVDAEGYWAVWAFRNQVIGNLDQFFRLQTPGFGRGQTLSQFRRIEGPFWQMIQDRPLHLLDPTYESWDQLLDKSVESVIEDALQDNARGLKRWGQVNISRVQHPLSMAVPYLSPFLDMPSLPLRGGWSDMPRIQGPRFGASQRMAVSPGKEEDGYMHMPGGQSGHPLSPYYGSMHYHWVEGKPTPFLPGKARHLLTITPAG